MRRGAAHPRNPPRRAAADAGRPPLLLPLMPSIFDAPGDDGAGVTGVTGDAAGRDVAVTGFGRTVEVYGSKQKPKRLTIYCDDFRWGRHLHRGRGRAHGRARAARSLPPFPHANSARSFVVKGGEDVRMDERAQQLFRLVAALAGRAPDCVARGLAGGGGGSPGGSPGGALVTYDVVPLSERLGLLEFVQARGGGGCACVIVALQQCAGCLHDGCLQAGALKPFLVHKHARPRAHPQSSAWHSTALCAAPPLGISALARTLAPPLPPGSAQHTHPTHPPHKPLPS